MESSDRRAVDEHLADDGTIDQLTASVVPFDAWQKENPVTEDPGRVKPLADTITAHTHFAQDPGGRLYRFRDGVYRPDGAAHVKRLVKGLLEVDHRTKNWSTHLSTEVVEYIRVDAPTLWERPPLGTINVRNGLLDVETRVLRPHSPDWLSTVQLPVTYDSAAGCTTWDCFVSEVFPSDAKSLAFEIIAHLMRPDTSIQKAVLLLGEGGNGKSTYLMAARAFLGKENVGSLSLHKLESDRFAVARLLGKLANISADLPSAHLVGTSVFKAITGGDAIVGEFKYSDSFEFVPFARLVFSANHAPRSADASAAFFDRWIVVPFTRTFRGTTEEIPRAELDARLSDPGELSGVLNRALDALGAMRGRGGRLLESESMRAAADEFRETTDPVAIWLDQATVEIPDALVSKAALLSAYNAAAERNSRPRLTATAFGLAMKRLRPHLTDAQRIIADRVQWVWLGLGLSPGSDAEPGRDRDSRT